MFHTFSRVLWFGLGLLAIAMGAALVLWCLFNVLVMRLPEYSGPGLLEIVFGGFGIATLLIGCGRHWLCRALGRNPSDEGPGKG